eukprot:SAG11_NODE_10730_length_809_cov_1.352113_2_plen_122_part_01
MLRVDQIVPGVGHTALMLASISGHLEVVRVLMDEANVEKRDAEGHSVVDLARAHGHTEIVAVLEAQVMLDGAAAAAEDPATSRLGAVAGRLEQADGDEELGQQAVDAALVDVDVLSQRLRKR